MQVLLEVIADPDEGKVFRLRQGQIAEVGRTEWADFCLSGDPELAETHFTLHCDPRSCRIVVNDAAGELLLNGEPVTEQVLHTGDRITAGGTSFSVTYDGLLDGVDPGVLSGGGEGPDDADEVAAGPEAAELAAGLKLGEDARELLQEGLSPEDYYTALIESGLTEDAVRFLAI